MITSIPNDTSPLLKTKEEIREARALFIELNANAPWAVNEALRRRFSKAMLGHMRAEKVELDRAERRAEATSDAHRA